MREIYAVFPWKTNAELISDAAELGYLKHGAKIADVTYGLGNWWTLWDPGNDFWPSDLYSCDDMVSDYDFCTLPYQDNEFDFVCFDPPYKLNGTDQGEGQRYGIADHATVGDRYSIIRQGLHECNRILKPHGILLFKCQDQVSSGKVHWQTIDFHNYAHFVLEMNLIDMFHMFGNSRPQRTQVHSRRNYSSLMIFEKR